MLSELIQDTTQEPVAKGAKSKEKGTGDLLIDSFISRNMLSVRSSMKIELINNNQLIQLIPVLGGLSG